jgi:rhamnosyltransferase
VLPKPEHVSVVIPTKNAGSRFGDVLKALKAQEFDGVIDITIVDSGSDDRTTELAEEYGARVIRINPDTFDHGLARNLAIEHVSGDVVVLLTQHAVPGTHRMISELVKALEDSAVAGVYGRRISHFDTEALARREIQESFAGGIDPGAVAAEGYEALTPIEKYVLCNFDHSCAAIRKSVWQEFPFRHNNFAEDLEWGRRVVAAGWKISYQPAAIVTDYRHRSFLDEYKRTYLYHGKLYSLFGLATSRTFLDALNSVPHRTSKNWSYVWRTEPSLRRRLTLLGKVPFLTLLTTYAEYRGTCSEKARAADGRQVSR